MSMATMGKGILLFMLAYGAAAGESNASCSASPHVTRGVAMIQRNADKGKTLTMEPEDPALSEMQSVCGEGEEILDVDCLKPWNMALQISLSKATLYLSRIGCTGWIVKLPTSSQGALVLTAGHCGVRNPETFYFEYNTPCGGKNSDADDSKRCQGTRLARRDPPDDYTLYEVDKACQHVAGITPFKLDVGEPSDDEGMYLIGHPNGRPKKISFQEVHDDGHHCEVRGMFTSSGSKRVKYYCDTQGGNSGSPIISARTGYAFAIHTWGGCNGNKMSANSGALLKNNVELLRQFEIPFVDRGTTDIFKEIKFIEKTVCPKSKTQASLGNKQLNACKTTCMNALKCVGFIHSDTDCIVVYEVHPDQPQACLGSSAFYERVFAAPAPVPAPTPATLVPGSVAAMSGGKNKKYCADDRDKVICNRDWIKGWEKFTVEDAGDGKIALKGGRDGKYCADESSKVVCNRDRLLGWEKFTVEDAGDGKIALKGGRGGQYCADEGDKVICNRNQIGGWEKFTVQDQR